MALIDSGSSGVISFFLSKFNLARNSSTVSSLLAYGLSDLVLNTALFVNKSVFLKVGKNSLLTVTKGLLDLIVAWNDLKNSNAYSLYSSVFSTLTHNLIYSWYSTLI
jgi:hypothetical protein